MDDVLKRRMERFDNVEEEISDEVTSPLTSQHPSHILQASAGMCGIEEPANDEEDATASMGLVQNPFSKDESPMVLLRSEGVEYLGGFGGDYDDGSIEVIYPMRYIEQMGPPTTPEAGPELMVGAQKVFLALSIPSSMKFSYSYLYFLPADTQTSKEVVSLYESAVKSAMAGDSNLEAPSAKDVLAYGRGNDSQ